MQSSLAVKIRLAQQAAAEEQYRAKYGHMQDLRRPSSMRAFCYQAQQSNYYQNGYIIPPPNYIPPPPYYPRSNFYCQIGKPEPPDEPAPVTPSHYVPSPPSMDGHFSRNYLRQNFNYNCHQSVKPEPPIEPPPLPNFTLLEGLTNGYYPWGDKPPPTPLFEDEITEEKKEQNSEESDVENSKTNLIAVMDAALTISETLPKKFNFECLKDIPLIPNDIGVNKLTPEESTAILHKPENNPFLILQCMLNSGVPIPMVLQSCLIAAQMVGGDTEEYFIEFARRIMAKENNHPSEYPLVPARLTPPFPPEAHMNKNVQMILENAAYKNNMNNNFKRMNNNFKRMNNYHSRSNFRTPTNMVHRRNIASRVPRKLTPIQECLYESADYEPAICPPTDSPENVADNFNGMSLSPTVLFPSNSLSPSPYASQINHDIPLPDRPPPSVTASPTLLPATSSMPLSNPMTAASSHDFTHTIQRAVPPQMQHNKMHEMQNDMRHELGHEMSMNELRRNIDVYDVIKANSNMSGTMRRDRGVAFEEPNHAPYEPELHGLFKPFRDLRMDRRNNRGLNSSRNKNMKNQYNLHQPSNQDHHKRMNYQNKKNLLFPNLASDYEGYNMNNNMNFNMGYGRKEDSMYFGFDSAAMYNYESGNSKKSGRMWDNHNKKIDRRFVPTVW